MQRVRNALLVFVALTLSACATLSFDQRLASAYSTNTGVRVTTTAALDGRRISSGQAENALAITDQTRKVLDESAAGDERGLQLAIKIMQSLEEFAR